MFRRNTFLRILPRGLPLLLALSGFPAARAELLYFVKGGQVQAPADVKDGRVLIETPIGTYEFLETDFLKIVPGGCPEREWGPKRDAALKAGAEARATAAWWAIENGLIPESVEMLRSAHAADPGHQPTARLVALLDQLNRPCDDPDTDRLCRALGLPCEVARGPHVLLLHQQGPAEAKARVDLLERVVMAYYLVLSAQGIELEVPRRRLVSVYLRDRQDYLAFLQSQHAGAFRSTLGYYHPTFRAVIAFDERTTGRPQAARDAADRHLSESPSGGDRKATARSAGTPDPRRRDLNRRRFLAEMEQIARDHGTAAHEMVHLLVHESGLCTRPGEFPLWFHEGFAAQFEVVRGGRWAGVGRAHDLRLPDWRALPPPPDLSSLVRDAGFGHGYRRDLYAKSWSLVYFLRKTRPREFLTFLDLLRLPTPAPDPDDPDRLESLFRSSFGMDLRSLESEWHKYMFKIQTPTEENAVPVLPFPG